MGLHSKLTDHHRHLLAKHLADNPGRYPQLETILNRQTKVDAIAMLKKGDLRHRIALGVTGFLLFAAIAALGVWMKIAFYRYLFSTYCT